MNIIDCECILIDKMFKTFYTSKEALEKIGVILQLICELNNFKKLDFCNEMSIAMEALCGEKKATFSKKQSVKAVSEETIFRYMDCGLPEKYLDNRHRFEVFFEAIPRAIASCPSQKSSIEFDEVFLRAFRNQKLMLKLIYDCYIYAFACTKGRQMEQELAHMEQIKNGADFRWLKMLKDGIFFSSSEELAFFRDISIEKYYGDAYYKFQQQIEQIQFPLPYIPKNIL